jgi:hypothetical protein
MIFSVPGKVLYVGERTAAQMAHAHVRSRAPLDEIVHGNESRVKKAYCSAGFAHGGVQ